MDSTAGTVGILAFGIKACKGIIEFYTSARDSRADIKDLCTSAQALSRLLSVIDSMIGQPGVDDATTNLLREHLNACVAGLNRLSEKLEKAKASNDGRFRALFSAAQYPFKEKTIAKLKSIITQELIPQLNLALNTLNFATSLTIRDDATVRSLATDSRIKELMVEAESICEDVLESNTRIAQDMASVEQKTNTGLETVIRVEKAVSTVDKNLSELSALVSSHGIGGLDLRGEVLAWVSCGHLPESSHRSARAETKSGTGNWFLNGSTFKHLISHPASIVWLHGIPGCGKTILCSSIIEKIAQHCSFKDDYDMAYFYISFDNKESQSPENIIRSLASQLISKHKTLPESLVDIYKRYKAFSTPFEVWMDVLRIAVLEWKQTFLIIDALDECPSVSGERRQLLMALNTIISLGIPNLHILATSRREHDINLALSKIVTTPSIAIQDGEIGHDIQTYIRTEIQNDSRLSSWPPSIRKEIEDVLMAGAHGMFRWVVCQLDSVKECLRLSTVRQTLQSLPTTLDATYERILLSIKPEYKCEAINALQWLVASERPLLLEELAEAAIIEVEKPQVINLTDRLLDPRSILKVLSTLVVQTSDEDDNPEVRLAHYSVREYLTSDRIFQTKSHAANFKVNFKSAHSHIALSCIGYLSCTCIQQATENCSLKSPVTGKLPPLIRYSSQYWARHVLKCGAAPLPNLNQCVVKFLQSSTTVDLWTRLFKPILEKPNYSFYGRNCSAIYDKISLLGENFDDSIQVNIASPLYYAACMGLTTALLELLRTNSLAEAEDSKYESPLLVASYKGHLDAVNALLLNGANVNQTSDVGIWAEGRLKTALQAACVMGHTEIVEVLLNASPNYQFEELLMNLASSKQQPKEDIVLKLLDKAKDINHNNIAIGWLMRWAAAEGHATIVAHLLTKMTKLDQKTRFEWTVPDGDWLEFNAALKPSRYYSYMHKGSAPYGAAVEGNIEVLRLLLPRWSNINEIDAEGRTALYWATLKSNRELVELLLRYSPDTHIRVGRFGPARCWAIFNERDDIRELLEGACKMEYFILCAVGVY